MFLPVSVCSLSVCPLDYSESYETDFDEIFWSGGMWPKKQI